MRDYEERKDREGEQYKEFLESVLAGDTIEYATDKKAVAMIEMIGEFFPELGDKIS